jgi:aminoglycoside 3-N-acetyltransferase I
MIVRRLDPRDVAIAKRLFRLMADVFAEEAEERPDVEVEALLSDPRFWAVAAMVDDDVIGGATAHTIPMTHKAAAALFVYDIAVCAGQQRRGVGRELMGMLRAEAAQHGIDDVFVLADNADVHALAFYRALGAAPSAVTMFELGAK